jgi:hypothetical protein
LGSRRLTEKVAVKGEPKIFRAEDG